MLLKFCDRCGAQMDMIERGSRLQIDVTVERNGALASVTTMVEVCKECTPEILRVVAVKTMR